MKYLKTFEGIFDFFKKKVIKEIDPSELRDLIESEIGDNIIFKSTGPDGHKITSVESALESGELELAPTYYLSDNNGPLIRKTIWFDREIESTTPCSSENAFGRKNLSGIGLRRKHHGEIDLDMRDGFFFMFNLYKEINKERMKEYGIGFCLGGYSHDEILFYPIVDETFNESDKMSDGDAQELLKAFKNLSDTMDRAKHRVQTYTQYQKRLDTCVRDEKGNIPGKTINKLADKYEEYFYSMMDDGWRYYRDNAQFYSKIQLDRPVKYEDAEKELSHIVNEMSEIKSRFIADGFNCHFLISYDGKGQQELNELTHRSDNYKFNGVGDRKSLTYYDKEYPPSIFPRDEYFLARIEFVYI